MVNLQACFIGPATVEHAPGRSDANADMTTVREPAKLPVVLSPDEVARLLEAAPGLKYRAALSLAYGAGLRASEVVSLKVSDIDSKRVVIRVEQGKGHKDRYAMLSAPFARSAADLVGGGPPAGRDVAGWLVVSRPEPGQSAVHPPTEARL